MGRGLAGQCGGLAKAHGHGDRQGNEHTFNQTSPPLGTLGLIGLAWGELRNGSRSHHHGTPEMRGNPVRWGWTSLDSYS
jgi:hypothetical protein